MEGTAILHIVFALRLDHELGREFLKSFKVVCYSFVIILIYLCGKIFLIIQILISADIIWRPVSFQCCSVAFCGSHPAL